MRRIREDGPHTEADMMAAQEPVPPAHIHLPDDAIPAWRSIVRARDYKSWTAIDLEHAANLAVCFSDMERLRHEIRSEGDVIRNERGTQIMNPKHSLLEVLSRRSVALSRMLHVHAEATVGESRHQAKRSQKQREVIDAKESAGGLIARPKH